MQIFRGLAIASCALILSGCAMGEEDGPRVRTTSHSLVRANDIAFNRLAFNRLAFNRLAFNRLAFNRLAFNRLAFNSLDNLEASPHGRELLTYIARCALDEGDILVATRGNRTFEFPGLLGLATEWEERPLTDSESRWVSGCLVALVNAFGVSVELSLRAPDRVTATEDEAETFSVYEATFFGQVFDETLEAYACLGSNPEIAQTHAPDRELRVCADPSPHCQVEALGYCRDICDTYLSGYGWTGCQAGGVRYDETVSTFLRAAGDNLCQARCPANTSLCHPRCADPQSSEPSPHDDEFRGDRILDCNGASGFCVGRCPEGTCSLDACNTGVSFAQVLDGATAEVACTGTETCLVECRDPGTRCDVDCTGAGICAIERCEDGAACLADCTGAESCGITTCAGELQTCPGDIVVCNRPCP